MKKTLPYIPFIIMVSLMAYSIYTLQTSNIIFSTKHYIGLGLVSIALIALLFNAFINKAATFLALVLATLGLAAFTPAITTYRFGFTIGGKGPDMVIQPYCLFLLVLFILLNRPFFARIFKDNSDAA